jgi:SulP family sulfate permease
MGPGFVLMRSWIRDSVLRGSVSDRVLTVVIPLTVAFFGVLAGVGLGVVIAASLFVWRYATLDPVRNRTSGTVLRSSLDRSSVEAATLDARGSEIVAMRLEGYLFFGSAARIGENVRSLLNEQQDLRHVIVDLFHVSGIDSSAQAELHELARLACERGVLIQYACAPESLVRSFDDSANLVGFASDLDHALEVAEDDLLASAEFDAVEAVDPLAEVGTSVIGRFSEEAVSAGDVLMSAGDRNAGLFLVAEGTLTVWAPVEGTARRLRRVGPGAYLGEVGFFAGEPATATVIADGPAKVLRLTHTEFERIRNEEPDLALELIQQVLAVTAHRLNLTNALVGDLLR